MNIGKTIKELRNEQGITQVELALKSKITQAALSAIENGKRPGTTTLKNLCNSLNVPEALLYALSMELSDVKESQEVLYSQLFPVIKDLVLKIVKSKD